MADMKKMLLYGLLIVIGYTLWTDWQKEHPPVPLAVVVKADNSKKIAVPQNVPPLQVNEVTQGQDVVRKASAPALSVASEANLSFVDTDVIKAGFDLNSGDLVDVKFLKYTQSVDDKSSFVMFNDDASKKYIALTRLYNIQDKALSTMKVTFDPQSFSVNENRDLGTWDVSFQGQADNGLTVKKQYTFEQGKYLIHVKETVTNNGEAPWTGAWSTQFLQHEPKEDKSSLFHLGSYSGASYSTPEKTYKKVSYENMQEANLDVTTQAGWIAMQQHYFVSAWIPPQDSKHQFYTQVQDQDYQVGVLSKPVQLNPAQFYNFESNLYVGPELLNDLKAAAPGLEKSIDYGWLSFISEWLFWVLQKIYLIVGNWGLAIILVTVFIKLVFYHLSTKSYTSMAKMRQLQPKIEALRMQYADDKTKLSQATMELYRKEKVNPLGGCLPIVVQIPVFIALYWVLLESIQLRQAPFFFWIHDLAMPDPYYILPLLMGISMFVQQKLNPPPPDPTQAKMMLFLPVIFTGLFLHFPAGLVLYWTVNNILSITQQWYITRQYDGTHKKGRRA